MTEAPSTLRDLLLARAATDPDRLAFDDGRRRVTYGELLKRASGQAARLADAGLRPRDRVAFAMNAGVACVEAFWAVQLLGAATCHFNPHVPGATLERRIAGIRPRLVVRDGHLEDATPHRTAPADPGIGPDDLAYLQPTSGTSGEPRAAMLLHRNVLAYLAADDEPWARRDDVFVDWVPPWHDYGLVRFIIGGVAHGAACHIVEPAVKTIPQWLATVSRVRGTVSGAPDYAYGLAETVLGVTATLDGQPHTTDARGNFALGPPRAGLEIRVDGDLDEPGEILLRGDATFAGYFDAPEDTAAALRDGWLHTGDVGYFEDGNLYVLGRERAMIKRGGAVIAPRELEEVAEDVEGVRIAVAVGLPDSAGGSETAVVAVEHASAGSDAADAVAAAVSDAVRGALGFAPGRVTVTPPRTIPRTENGKIRHARLREMLLEGAGAAA